MPAPRDDGLLTVHELRVETGLSHGLLFRPLPVWLDPVVAVARGDAAFGAAAK